MTQLFAFFAAVAAFFAPAGALGNAPVALDGVEAGWWTKSSSAQAPDGGVVVSGGATGPRSVAAVRVTMPGGATHPILRMREAGGRLTNLAAIRVCRASRWKPATGGPYAEAPAANCSTTAALRRDDAGDWTADLTAFGRDASDQLNVVLQPVTRDPAAPGSLAAFSVVFQRPSMLATLVAKTDAESAAPSLPDEPPAARIDRETYALPSIAAPTAGIEPTAEDPPAAIATLGALAKEVRARTSWTEATVLLALSLASGAAVAAISRRREAA